MTYRYAVLGFKSAANPAVVLFLSVGSHLVGTIAQQSCPFRRVYFQPCGQQQQQQHRQQHPPQQLGEGEEEEEEEGEEVCRGGYSNRLYQLLSCGLRGTISEAKRRYRVAGYPYLL